MIARESFIASVKWIHEDERQSRPQDEDHSNCMLTRMLRAAIVAFADESCHQWRDGYELGCRDNDRDSELPGHEHSKCVTALLSECGMED